MSVSSARHGKAVYWDLGSAQSLGTVTADLKPGVARVEVGAFGRWDNQLGPAFFKKFQCVSRMFQECLHFKDNFQNAFKER